MQQSPSAAASATPSPSRSRLGGAENGAGVQYVGAPVVGRYDGLGTVGLALGALDGT